MSVREIISIFYPDSKARLEELVVDAFFRETHNFSSELSEYPIESGGSIVDHVHNKSLCLSLEGIISNTPINLVGLTAVDSAVRYLEKQSNDFALIAFGKIEELFKKRRPISIATSLKIYHTMVLESLSIERGGGFSSDTLHFSCTAKQINIIDQERIKIPQPKESRAKPKQKRGLQENKSIPKAQAEKLVYDNSLLFSISKKLLAK